ncbi:hypothetical protein ACFL6I_24960 [candidate division KSB1 bacterium]
MKKDYSTFDFDLQEIKEYFDSLLLHSEKYNYAEFVYDRFKEKTHDELFEIFKKNTLEIITPELYKGWYQDLQSWCLHTTWKMSWEVDFDEKVGGLAEYYKENKPYNIDKIKTFFSTYDFQIDLIRAFAECLNTPSERILYYNWIELDYFRQDGAKKRGSESLDIEFKKMLKFEKQYLEVEREHYSSASVNENSDNQENDKKNTEKLKWQGTQSQLVYLFDTLEKKGFVKRSHEDGPFYSIIANVFTDKNGKQIKSHNLRQTAQNRGPESVRNKADLDDIISDLDKPE